MINENIELVAFTGFAQTGKDSATKILEKLGYTRLSFADPVRQGIYNINPLIIIFPDEFNYEELKEEFIKGSRGNLVLRLKDVVDFLGWDSAKKIPEVRRLLQYYGTEGIRNILGEDIWIQIVEKFINHNKLKKVAISDLRFKNELDWVKNNNGKIIKINRQGVNPINNHISDRGINDELCDFIINNNNTLVELELKIKEILNV